MKVLFNLGVIISLVITLTIGVQMLIEILVKLGFLNFTLANLILLGTEITLGILVGLGLRNPNHIWIPYLTRFKVL